jgi:hypothetical protein
MFPPLSCIFLTHFVFLREKNVVEDNEEKITPTAEDWENIIIPCK